MENLRRDLKTAKDNHNAVRIYPHYLTHCMHICIDLLPFCPLAIPS